VCQNEAPIFKYICICICVCPCITATTQAVENTISQDPQFNLRIQYLLSKVSLPISIIALRPSV